MIHAYHVAKIDRVKYQPPRLVEIVTPKAPRRWVKEQHRIAVTPWTNDLSNKNTSRNKYMLLRSACSQVKLTDTLRTDSQVYTNHIAFVLYFVLNEIYSTSQELWSCFARCCTLFWFVLVYFTHILNVDSSDAGSIIRLCQWGVGLSISYESKNYNQPKILSTGKLYAHFMG